MNKNLNKAQLFDQHKEELKSISEEDLNALLVNDKITIKKIDRLWNVVYSVNPEEGAHHSIIGANLSYILSKMIKARKEEDERNVSRLRL